MHLYFLVQNYNCLRSLAAFRVTLNRGVVWWSSPLYWKEHLILIPSSFHSSTSLPSEISPRRDGSIWWWGAEANLAFFSHRRRHDCLGFGDLEFLVNGNIWNVVVTQAVDGHCPEGKSAVQGRDIAHRHQCHTSLHPEMDQHNCSISASTVPLWSRRTCLWGVEQEHPLRSDESYVFSSYHHKRHRTAQEVWGPVMSTSEYSSKCGTMLHLT